MCSFNVLIVLIETSLVVGFVFKWANNTMRKIFAHVHLILEPSFLCCDIFRHKIMDFVLVKIELGTLVYVNIVVHLQGIIQSKLASLQVLKFGYY